MTNTIFVCQHCGKTSKMEGFKLIEEDASSTFCECGCENKPNQGKYIDEEGDCIHKNAEDTKSAPNSQLPEDLCVKGKDARRGLKPYGEKALIASERSCGVTDHNFEHPADSFDTQDELTDGELKIIDSLNWILIEEYAEKKQFAKIYKAVIKATNDYSNQDKGESKLFPSKKTGMLTDGEGGYYPNDKVQDKDEFTKEEVKELKRRAKGKMIPLKDLDANKDATEDKK